MITEHELIEAHMYDEDVFDSIDFYDLMEFINACHDKMIGKVTRTFWIETGRSYLDIMYGARAFRIIRQSDIHDKTYFLQFDRFIQVFNVPAGAPKSGDFIHWDSYDSYHPNLRKNLKECGVPETVYAPLCKLITDWKFKDVLPEVKRISMDE